jgi:hypothetical protein
MHQLVSPAKALRTMRKTPLILSTVLHNVSQEQAATLRDGPDGWSILYILCHLRDVELIFTKRAQDLLERPNPTFTVVSNEELIAQGRYGDQEARAVLEQYFAHRRAFIALLESVADEQWRLAGTHPQQGPATLLDVAVNTGLHDVDHSEQIICCLTQG